jgi:endonuclease/exonuclease/phosphatase family metal-dependent hydrolase
LAGRPRLPLLLAALLAALLGLLIVIRTLIASRSVINYTDPDWPSFEGSYAPKQPTFDGTLKAVTWNIAFAEKTEQAIAELSEMDRSRSADVLVLQEMDEEGTDQIARALGYNYVYYPASIHSHHDRNFGNAVLSRWPIVDSAKIILPHENPSNNQIRIATMATIDVEGRQIPVYSVHTETFWLGPKQRNDQIEALAAAAASDLAQGLDYVIIGGDFNTVTSKSLNALTSKLEEVGLHRVSQNAGKSLGLAGIGISLDHIFASNMTPLSAGISTETKASDHHPVWVLLELDQLQ